MGLAAPLWAQERVADLYSRNGRVEGRTPQAPDWREIDTGTVFHARDSIKTGVLSRAAVHFESGVLVRMNESSLLELPGSGGAGVKPLAVRAGSAYFFSRDPTEFPEIATPTVSVAVRGTEFVIDSSKSSTVVSVLGGSVHCANAFGAVDLVSGEQAIAESGKAPVKRIMVNPLDAVQWALNYPVQPDIGELALFYRGRPTRQREGWAALARGDLAAASAAFAGNDWADLLGQAAIAESRGDEDRAFDYLARIKDPAPAPRLFLATLLLTRGQIGKAEATLAALENDLGGFDAETRKVSEAGILTRRAIIDVVNNRKERAAENSTRALELSGDSVPALLAASFVEQSSLRLEKARELAERALALRPDDVSVRSRLAELLLSFGESESALRQLDAVPESRRGHPYYLRVRGFSELIRYDASGAERLFRKAIAADQSDGLSHLGLGLALVRLGMLQEGRTELQKAAHLEPSVSIYRSYLGKIFFEQDRRKLANEEYERAIALDPLDPTPYLYRTYNRLADFYPVGALRDIEESIRLNGSRAVYRSSLLLDRDLGVRGTGLADTFTLLNFLEAARSEAIKSLNRDYANYSAHLLLASAYLDNPALGEALISENQVGTLLAPLNFNTLLPNNSTTASLNEYSALFDRPLVRTRIDGALRSRDRLAAAEASNRGSFGSFGYALDYQSSYLDGDGRNDWQRLNAPQVALQYQTDPHGTLKVNSGLAFRERGDRLGAADPIPNDPDFREELDANRSSIGYHRDFGPGHDLIAQLSYDNQHFDTRDLMRDRLLTANLIVDGQIVDVLHASQSTDETYKQRLEGERASIQLIDQWKPLTNVAGFEYLKGHAAQSENSLAHGQDSSFPVVSAGSHDENRLSAYLYPTWHALDWLDMHAGLNYSQIDLADDTPAPPFSGGDSRRRRVNPKGGATFYVTPDLTTRVAYFRNSGISGGLDRESLEPTFVGGFNQRFDDTIGGTESDNYAAGFDYKIPGSGYFGVEGIERRLRQDLRFVDSVFDIDLNAPDVGSAAPRLVPGFVPFDSRATLLKAYIYEVLGDQTTSTLDYAFSRDRSDAVQVADALLPMSDVHTHRFRMGVNYIDRSGLVPFGSLSWYDQYSSGFGASNTNGDFWLLELALAYLLPDRHGSLVLKLNNVLNQHFDYLPSGLGDNPLPFFNVSFALTYNF